MPAQLLYPHIVKPNGKPAHLERVPRVRVAQVVMDYLVHGWSVEEMCRQHSYLNPSEAHAAMAYYYDHPEEIEREIAEESDQLEREKSQSPRSSFYHRMKAKGIL